MPTGEDHLRKTSGSGADDAMEAIGASLFEDVLTRFVTPAVGGRLAEGSLAEGTVIYRFQVLLFFEGDPEVRINEEVGGTATLVATRRIEAGEDVTTDDFSGVSGYTPLPEDAETPHVTAFRHRDGWSIAFQLGFRHPARHKFLALGRDFAATAREAMSERRVGVALDTAFSAAELLAKAELLSCAPTIQAALAARTHGNVRESYSLWARLDNTDRRFVKLLGRLQELRRPTRYLQGDVSFREGEPELLIDLLDEMLEHVDRIANNKPTSDEPRSYNVVATRELRQGQLVRASDFTLRPR